MDKYEYKLKTEQMLKLMENGAYNRAAEIADSIDWKRVRNVNMLLNVSNIYEKIRDYRKSFGVLRAAYHRTEGSRKILYRLCTLAIKVGNLEEAIDYYDEYVQAAPKDPNQYILRYRLLRARRAPIEQQIRALEQFKKAEYVEEWAYELAKRYEEAGMTAECLEECDDLILWFSEGKYVYKAMELKMRYKPLTPLQQEKYDRRLEEAEKRIFTVMMGGAVGGFNATGLIGRKVQENVAEMLSMNSMEVPSRNMTQMKVEYLMNLCLLCNTFHKMAEEVYYTGIEEFGEVHEGFTPGTIGSSTMPQKINPKLAKGIIANSQKLYSLPATGLYSGVRMFEGDSSSYMLFDGLMEEGMELATEVIIRAEELTRTLYVNKERLLKNANINEGLDNSEYVMMNVAAKLGKDAAHQLLYDKAMKTELEGKNYLQVLLDDEVLSSMFTKEELEKMIAPSSYTGICSVLARELADKAEDKAKMMTENKGKR